MVAPSLKESVSFLFKIIWKQSVAFTSIKMLYVLHSSNLTMVFQQQKPMLLETTEFTSFSGVLLPGINGNHKKSYTLADSIVLKK